MFQLSKNEIEIGEGGNFFDLVANCVEEELEKIDDLLPETLESLIPTNSAKRVKVDIEIGDINEPYTVVSRLFPGPAGLTNKEKSNTGEMKLEDGDKNGINVETVELKAEDGDQSGNKMETADKMETDEITETDGITLNNDDQNKTNVEADEKMNTNKVKSNDGDHNGNSSNIVCSQATMSFFEKLPFIQILKRHNLLPSNDKILESDKTFIDYSITKCIPYVYSIDWAKKSAKLNGLKGSKAPFIIGVVNEIIGSIIILKDYTGEITATIERSAKDKYYSIIKTGCVLLLVDISIFSLSKDPHLIITLKTLRDIIDGVTFESIMLSTSSK